jgi:hypothetical protein
MRSEITGVLVVANFEVHQPRCILYGPRTLC